MSKDKKPPKRSAPRKISDEEISGNKKLAALIASLDERVELKPLLARIDPALSPRAIDKLVENKFENGLCHIMQKVNIEGMRHDQWVVDPEQFGQWYLEYHRPKQASS